jgi:hypothetical protein
MAVYRNGVEATSGDTSAAFINGEANFHIGGIGGGDGGIAVEPSGKAATTWAHLKVLE